jgi:hypothetical protein
MALTMLSEVQVVKACGRERFDRLVSAGVLTPSYNAEGYEGQPVYPEHLVVFRLDEDDRLRGHRATAVAKGTPRPRARKSRVVYVQQPAGRPVAPAVERAFLDLRRLVRKGLGV